MNNKDYLIKNYEIFTGEDLIIADLIQRRRYQLLVHSCIYYRMNTSMVPNYDWDAWAKELVELQGKYPDISKQVMLYEYFNDWDGSTGMHLPLHLDWVIRIAEKLLGNIFELSKPDIVPKKKLDKRRKLF